MTTQTIERMAVEVSGEGEPVVLLHGLGGTTNTWTPLAAALQRHRCIRPDLPGAGRSPLPASGQLTIATLVESLLRMLQVLGVERARFVGHSMGTILCQHIAVQQPRLVQGLALFGPLAAPPDQARAGLKARAETARAEGMGDIADAIVNAATAAATRERNPVAAALVRESVMRQDPKGYAANCEALAAAEAADAARIACPTLLVTGEDDVVAPPSVARQLGEKIEGARVHVLPRCGHWTPFEAPEACNGHLKEFLARRQ